MKTTVAVKVENKVEMFEFPTKKAAKEFVKELTIKFPDYDTLTGIKEDK